MADWYFVSWTIQYLIGFVIALLISVYILRKYPKSRAYQSFFLFGFSISLWALFTLLHRNAPTADISKDLFRGVLFFSIIAESLVPLTVLYIEKKKTYFLLVTVPAIIVGTSGFIMVPFEMVWSNYGWSYSANPSWRLVMSGIGAFYLLITVIVLSVKIKRSLISILKKKYVILLVGYGGLYGVGMAITNMMISSDPTFPPIGGILLTAAFLVIAYGIALPAEKIELQKSREKVETRKY